MEGLHELKQNFFPGGLLRVKEGRIIDADKEALLLLNAREHIISKPLDSVLTAEILSPSTEKCLYTILKRSSDDLLVISSATPYLDDEYLIFLCLLKDLKIFSDIKKSIGENFDSFISIIETMHDDVLITDGKGIILSPCPSFEDTYGVSAEEIVGTSVYDGERQGLFRPSVVAIALREKRKVTRMQESIFGGRFPCTAIPVFDENKEIIRVITYASSSHDIEQIKQLSDEIAILENRMKKFASEINKLREKELIFRGIIAKSSQMKNIVNLSVKVAEVDINLLVTGESGVGKNLLTRLIHQHSLRKDGPFIEINCGAIPETLLESELFGYEPGSFTGARREGKLGMIELAHNGTLFLDEIGELSQTLQVKLLKLIQEKKLTKVGGTKQITVDCRIIAATNRDLKKAVEEGSFRDDLYYRLNVVPINIPPIRERKEDLLSLITSFLDEANEKYSKKKFFTSESIDVLLNYNWPGNVREVRNIIERIVITSDRDRIEPSELPIELQGFSSMGRFNGGISLKSAKEMIEKELVTKAYDRFRTTVGVAKFLKISQASAARKVKQYIHDSLL